MQIAVIFHNIGGYHAARLRAAQQVFASEGWQLQAIQETDNADEHPWGNLSQEMSFPLKTLLPAVECQSTRERDPQASVAAKRLTPYLNQLLPDILVIPGWGYPISRAALRWAKQRNCPTVLMSESKWDDVPRSWWKEKLKSWLYTNKFKAAIVGGSLHVEYLEGLGFPRQAIFKGYDIVDNEYFTKNAISAQANPSAIRVSQPAIPQRHYFITVTRFIPRKNILRLIDAFKLYRQAIDASQAWDLVICGSGMEASKIKDRISQNHLEAWIHLPGFKTYQEIPSWFGLANAFIHPALHEQWGLVVNEAMACGLPVIVSNRCGCYPELVLEGETGYGFDPEDVSQLAQLMIKISSDEKTRQLIGKNAQQHIGNFAPKHFGQGLRNAVATAINHS